MDDAERRREYARRYRERNREMLRAKAREYHGAVVRAKRPPRKPQATPVERFWAKVTRGAPDECWEWTGATAHFGYGSFRPTPARAVGTHRFSWEIVNGPIPDGKHVLHHCDNPPCVNPAHLYIGTDVENARDRMERGGFVSNAHHAVAKRAPGWNKATRPDDRRLHRTLVFDDDQVREIRRRYAAGGCTMRSLAEDYGVKHPTIKNVIHGIGGYGRISSDSAAW